MPYVPSSSPQALGRTLRGRQTKVATAPTYDSEEEAGIESDGDATEDEYIPSPPLNPLKRRRSVISSELSLHSTSWTSSIDSLQPTKRHRPTSDGHNIQTSRLARRPQVWTAEDEKKWRCPHWPCDHRQWNKRGPDFRRHQRTHTAASAQSPYVCWGVRLEHADASRKSIPGPLDKRGVAVEYHGVMRIGGCFKTFSRKDALLRHLKRGGYGTQCATDYSDFSVLGESLSTYSYRKS
jgi:hypothetical protein